MPLAREVRRSFILSEQVRVLKLSDTKGGRGMAKLTLTRDDGSKEEFHPDSVIIQPGGSLRELRVMDEISRMMVGLNTNERKRIIAWLADRNVNTGVD